MPTPEEDKAQEDLAKEEAKKAHAEEINKIVSARLGREVDPLKKTIAELQAKLAQAPEPKTPTPDAKDAEIGSIKAQLAAIDRARKEQEQELIQERKEAAVSKAIAGLGVTDPDVAELLAAKLDKNLRYDPEAKKHFYHDGDEALEIKDAATKVLAPLVKKVTPAKPIVSKPKSGSGGQKPTRVPGTFGLDEHGRFTKF